MLGKNKIARITLVLFITLNILVINSSVIEANPVDSSYYNLYSHGESFDKPRTFNANEESNFEREKREFEEAKREVEEAKREAKEAKRQAEEAKRQAEEAKRQAEEAKQNHTGVLDTDTKNGIQKSKIDDFNYVNSDAYKDIAKAKCEKIAKEAVQKGSLLKANGERITDTNDICTEEALDQFTHCLAAYNAEGATPSNIDERVLNECANSYVLVAKSTSTYDKDEADILDKIKESLAEGFISTFSGVLPDSIVQAGAELIRELTWKDVAQELLLKIVITGGLMVLTGGTAGVALLAKATQLANKARRLINKAKVLKKGGETLETAKKAKSLASVEKEFITKAKDLTTEKIDNYKDAVEAIGRRIDTVGRKSIDSETKTLEEVGKQIKALNEEKIHDGGKSLVEIGQEAEKKASALQEEVSKINKQITKKEKFISNLKEKTEKSNPSNRKKIKEINKNKEIINETQDEIQKLQLQRNQKLEEINEAKTTLIEKKAGIDASKVKNTLDSQITKTDKWFGRVMVASSGATIITGSLGTEEINSCQVISNQNAHQTDTEVNRRTTKQYENEANDEFLSQEERDKARTKADRMQLDSQVNSPPKR